MVEVNITKPAINTGNTYMFKNIMNIQPLLMKDDTLAISTSGHKTKQITSFLNTRTNLMNLQYGREKCVKMQLGKKHNHDKCGDVSVDAWAETFSTTTTQTNVIKDMHVGKEKMRNVLEKKYLGDLISCDLKNDNNIRERIGKATGNVNIIVSTYVKDHLVDTHSRQQS